MTVSFFGHFVMVACGHVVIVNELDVVVVLVVRLVVDVEVDVIELVLLVVLLVVVVAGGGEHEKHPMSYKA